jgi:hypothetical protein
MFCARKACFNKRETGLHENNHGGTKDNPKKVDLSTK